MRVPKQLKQLTMCVMLLALLLPIGQANPGAAQELKILVQAIPTDVNTLDPAEMTSGIDWKPVGHIFDTLVRYDMQLKVTPHVAKSWELSADGLQWTFHLRDDVKFHDGTPLDAEAVVFTFERVYNPEHPFNQYGTWDNWSWYMYMVNKVEAVDKYTVRFILNYPYTPFLDTMANFATAIVSPTAYKEKKDKFRIEPVGSGPFKFVEWQKGDRIVLARNPDYFLGAPKLDQVIYRVIPENTARLSALKTGEVHVMSEVSPEIAEAVRQTEGLQLFTQPGLNLGWLRFNMVPELPGYLEPFGDRRVREAFIRAIDRQALLDAFFKGYGTIEDNPVPSVVWGRDESLKLPEFDPEKARQLLKEAGYPDGFKVEFWPYMDVRAYQPQPTQLSEAIQAYLKDIGIEVDIRQVEYGIWWDTVTTGKAQMHTSGWTGDFNDPDNFLFPNWEDSTTGFSFGWKNEEFANLLKQAQQEPDRAQRVQLYQKAQKIFFDELPGMPLFSGMYIAAVSNKVLDFAMRPDGEIWYAKMDMQ